MKRVPSCAQAAACWVIAAVAAAVGPAQASVVVDRTPTGTLWGTLGNYSTAQNFLVKFNLAGATDLTGFDIFTDNRYGSTGDTVKVRIRSDAGGNPATSNLFEFDDTVDSKTAFLAATPGKPGIDISALSFGAVTLAAGDYWIGVSGVTDELSWATFDNGGSLSVSTQRFLQGNTAFTFDTGFYDLAYRIRGEASVPAGVPEPVTLALVGLALAGLCATRFSATTR